MQVFITGGMGFIGSYIVMDLLKNGHQATILARDPNKIPAFGKMPGIEIVHGGLDDHATIAKALPGHDACIHNALYWGDTPTGMLKNDTLSSVSLFEAAAAAGVRHTLYTSSTAAMGPFTLRMDEETPLKPSDYYGATKASTEAYLLAFASKTPMRCAIVRPGYTIGNPVVEGAPIYSDARFKTIVKSALRGEEIKVVKNDGTQFVWAGDLAKIYSAALRSEVDRGVYFGLAEDFTTWEAIARKAVAATRSKSAVVVEDRGYPDAPNMFDLSKIKREFGLAFNSKKIIDEHLEYLIRVSK